MSKITLREFKAQMQAHRITNIIVESSSDAPGSRHVPSETVEYSTKDDTIKKLSSELMQEIYEGMLFRPTQVTLARQVGGTLEVKVG